MLQTKEMLTRNVLSIVKLLKTLKETLCGIYDNIIIVIYEYPSTIIELIICN